LEKEFLKLRRVIHEAIVLNLHQFNAGGSAPSPSPSGKPSTYQVLFYLDFNASISDMRCYHALQHLSEIAPFIRVIGSYPRDAVYLGRENEGRMSVWREVLYPLPASSGHPRSQRLRVGIVGM
jgi:hypothetical protein